NPYGKTDKRIYTELATDHPIDLCRYQVANGYMGRAGLINSGGDSGENASAEAGKTAVTNKRAGGMGLISGRKAFQRPMAEGAQLLQTIQDVYLCKDVTIAYGDGHDSSRGMRGRNPRPAACFMFVGDFGPPGPPMWLIGVVARKSPRRSSQPRPW